jgi:hypothetical protein
MEVVENLKSLLSDNWHRLMVAAAIRRSKHVPDALGLSAKKYFECLVSKNTHAVCTIPLRNAM